MATLSPTIVKAIRMVEDLPTTAFNDQIEIDSARSGVAFGAQRAILDFGDISSIPAGSTIDSAVLTLKDRTVVSGTADPACQAHPMIEFNWVAGQATWNEFSTGNSWSTPGGDYDTGAGISDWNMPTSGTGTDAITVTTTIQRILSQNPTTCQILLKHVVEDDLGGSFGAVAWDSHVGNNPPTLLITYTAPVTGGDFHRARGYRQRLRGRQSR